MARVALPPTVSSALLRQRGPLRAYQWIWLLGCVLVALAVGAPRIVTRPVLYTAQSAVQVDPARSYAPLVTTQPDAPNYAAERSEFDAVAKIAVGLLRVKQTEAGPVYPRLGSYESPNSSFSVSFAPQADGRVVVTTLTDDAAQAQRLADDAAEAFARSLRAAGGREIFRQLVGWEAYGAATGTPAKDAFQRDLRDIWLREAFPLRVAVNFVEKPHTVDMLAPEDRSDLARALEVREQELSQVDLYALRVRRDGAEGEARAQMTVDAQRLERGLASIRDALAVLYGTYGETYSPDAPSAVYRSQLAPAASVIDPQIPQLLGLVVLLGLVFGVLGVALDRSAGVMPKLGEIWSYRELIRNLVLRDLRVRYKGSMFGYLWTQLAPLLLMLVFLFVFSTLQKQAIALFPVFLIVGLLPWNFCAEAMTSGSRSIIDNANLIKKVFFPREILPMVSVISALVNYVLSLPMMFLVIAVAQLLYKPLGHINFSITYAYLPVLLLLEAMLMTGIVFFTSALAVSFRDFVHLIGILVQFWFFLTPVVYSMSNLQLSPAQEQAMRWLNPMASLIEFYHETLYGGVVYVNEIPVTAWPALDSVFRVFLTAVVVLSVGYWFFQRRSRTFGESI